ncbi:N-acetylmuramidase family protein [Craterilacuibacter sp. RT1T]|uniref:N-acetylmuramidase domain-containing protein n=1 Tax=Craterilacuibacter sp. RT1T TaxID=2942211 RepID=UPI0020C03A73|nr:N-acetylmuramidase family protein [Craterilacuibacter sp. RT1T]MCL6262184.1 N-acetylmuramidase family protein [Craterilacuibacter sp. RT1T]
MVLKHGSKGAAVTALQLALSDAGFSTEVDGWFGAATKDAVRRFQRSVGLAADGIAGVNTLRALELGTTRRALTEADIHAAAAALEVDAAAIRAVLDVESRGNGFDASGAPVVLFERHVFYRRLPPDMAQKLAASHPELCSQKRGGYQGGSAEQVRISRAAALCGSEAPAIESASWGLFQIMGYHWGALAYASAEQFEEAMNQSEGEQLRAFVKFVQVNQPVWRALKRKDWVSFARHYNGPAFAENLYDTKLYRAYLRHSKEAA